MNAILLSALLFAAAPADPAEPRPATATVDRAMGDVLARLVGSPLIAPAQDDQPNVDSVALTVESGERIVHVSFHPDSRDARKTVIEVSIRGRIGKFLEKAIAEAIARAILKRILGGILGG